MFKKQRIQQLDWKQEFKKDVKRKMRESKKEYNKYKKTNKIIFLQQAGNKLFSAVENILMVKYGKRTFSYSATLRLVTNKEDREILAEASQLHRFYYNGRLQMDRYTAKEIYNIVNDKMKERVKRI